MKRRIVIAVTAGLVLIAAAAAGLTARTVVKVRAALPPAPDLAARPAVLAAELAAAETDARSLWHARRGLERVARLYHANGFQHEALGCYRALAELDPRRPAWPHFIAAIESTFGQIDEALPWARRTLELAPRYAPAQLRLADMCFKVNQVPEAEQAYAALLRLEPGNPYALLGLARCQLRRGDEAGARQRLQEATTANPNFAAAWSLLATIEEKAGHASEAQAARKRGEMRFREMPDPWLEALIEDCYDPYQLSVAADISGNRPRAIELLERAIAVAPNVSTYQRQLAKQLQATGRTREARTRLERAVAINPTDSEAWSTLVTLLLEQRDNRAAMTALGTGLQHCPESGYLHYLNGNRLMAIGQTAAAEAALQRSKQLQPAETRAYVQLSVLYITQGRIADAMTEIDGAHAADPANFAVQVLEARIQIMAGKERAAEEWIRRLREAPHPDAGDIAQVVTLFHDQFGRDPR